MNTGQNLRLSPITTFGELLLFKISNGKLSYFKKSKFDMIELNGLIFEDVFIPDSYEILCFVRTCSKCNNLKGRLQLMSTLSEGGLIYSSLPASEASNSADYLSKIHVQVTEDNLIESIYNGYRLKRKLTSQNYIGLNPDKYGVFSEVQKQDGKFSKYQMPFIEEVDVLYPIFNGSFLYFLKPKRKK